MKNLKKLIFFTTAILALPVPASFAETATGGTSSAVTSPTSSALSASGGGSTTTSSGSALSASGGGNVTPGTGAALSASGGGNAANNPNAVTGTGSGSVGSSGVGSGTVGSTGVGMGGSVRTGSNISSNDPVLNNATADANGNFVSGAVYGSNSNTVGASSQLSTRDTSANLRGPVGILPVGGTLPGNAQVIAQGEIRNVDRDNNTVMVRDGRNGLIRTYNFPDAFGLQRLSIGDSVQIYSGR